MTNHFTIKIPCKPYIKAYLENNCGTPVNLSHLPDLLDEFRRGLQRKSERREKMEQAGCREMVSIIIPPDMFYRYGWEMNRSSILDFNRKIEAKVKFLMRMYVAVNHTVGTPVANCIREFQLNYGFPEQVWSFESIKKDFDRHGHLPEKNPMKEIKSEINKILLSNLSELGTVSQKYKKEVTYE
jgi:hypothetical protein